jgi:hypothetical protein
MRDVSQPDPLQPSPPQPQEPVFRRPAYAQGVIQRLLYPEQAPRKLGFRLMVAERRQGLSTFVLRELIPGLQRLGISSVYLPMKDRHMQDPAVRLRRALGLDDGESGGDGDGQALFDLIRIRLQAYPAGLEVFIDDVDLLQLTQAGCALISDLKVACEALRETRDGRASLQVVGLSADPRMLAVMTADPNAIWTEDSIERLQPMDVAYVRWMLVQLGDRLAPRLRNEDVAMDCFRRSRYCPGVLREVLL